MIWSGFHSGKLIQDRHIVFMLFLVLFYVFCSLSVKLLTFLLLKPNGLRFYRLYLTLNKSFCGLILIIILSWWFKSFLFLNSCQFSILYFLQPLTHRILFMKAFIPLLFDIVKLSRQHSFYLLIASHWPSFIPLVLFLKFINPSLKVNNLIFGRYVHISYGIQFVNGLLALLA